MYDDMYLQDPKLHKDSDYDFEKPRPDGVQHVVYYVGSLRPKTGWGTGETVTLTCQLIVSPGLPTAKQTLIFNNHGIETRLEVSKLAYAGACAKLKI